MYPLKTILVNCSETLLPTLRQVLHNYPAVSEGEFSRTGDAIDNCRWTQDESRLLIFHLNSIDSLEDLQRLRRTFGDWPIPHVGGRLRRAVVQPVVARQPGRRHPGRADAAGRGRFPLSPGGDRPELRLRHPQRQDDRRLGRHRRLRRHDPVLNIAYQIYSKIKQHTVLAELAFQKGMLATYLNVEPKYVIHDLLANSVKLDLHVVQQALTSIEPDFDILSGPHRQIMPLEVSPLDVNRLLDYLRRLCNVLILDVPCTNDEVYVQTLAAADQVVLVAEQTLPSLRSACAWCWTCSAARTCRKRRWTAGRFTWL